MRGITLILFDINEVRMYCNQYDTSPGNQQPKLRGITFFSDYFRLLYHLFRVRIGNCTISPALSLALIAQDNDNVAGNKDHLFPSILRIKMPDKPYIFISHSTKDNEFTHNLAEQLRQAGFNTWVDVESIPEGSTWAREIEKGVEECQSLVVVMSKNARESEWVEREILLAMQLKKPVFIALIEDVTLPIYLINRQYTDFRKHSKQAAERLIKALQESPSEDAADSSAKEDGQHSAKPNQHNFFKYMEQLQNGKLGALLARDLFHWAGKHLDSITFSGRKVPAMHAHVWAGAGGVILFSVRAYAKQPSIEVPLQYLQNFPPYDDREARVNLLNEPNLPLAALDKAETLEAFKDLMLEIAKSVRESSVTDDSSSGESENDSDE
jgi:hypothetical protein